MDPLKVITIVDPIIKKYYYDYNYTFDSNSINIIFVKTQYSSLRPDGYYEMVEEIIYNTDIMKNYNTKLLHELLNDGIRVEIKLI